MKGYYFITDRSLSRAGTLNDVRSAIDAGVTVIQYRDKNTETRAMYEEALALKDLCRKKARLLINDRVDIALAVEADGVHIGQDDMPFNIARRLLGKKRIIGLTVHSIDEAREAQELGADYVGVSPIYATATKRDAGKAAGIELIRAVKKEIRLPVIAIGGINLSNAPDVVAAGADGLCAISCVVTAVDAAGQMRRFQELFAKQGT